MKKTFFLFLLVAMVNLLGVFVSWSENTSKGNPPVITASYAVERGYYGYIWKIYLEAKDPDGDMSKIAAEVDQIGYGHYPTDWIILKTPYQRHLKGFLQWNTFSSRANELREWTNITLKITVIDKAGNESNVAVFPFEFVSGARREPKPPAPFTEEGLPRLGHINVDLYEPSLNGKDFHWDDK